jgi:adenylate cyclase
MVAEIERKYLVSNDSWRKTASTGTVLCQTYLVARKGRFVRIRVIDNARAFLAVKFRTSLMRREEFEYEIPYRDAMEMAAYSTDVLEKTRHEVVYCGYRWEIDVYSGSHEGLVLAEVELASENDTPPQPPWLGPEVTGDVKYSNRTIAAGSSPRSSVRATCALKPVDELLI